MTTRINEHYTMTKQTFHRQLMFDPTVPGCFRPLTRQEIQKQRLPKPEPVDVFRDNAEEKLWKIAGLQDADGYLGLALDAIRYFSLVIKTMTIRLSREIFIDIVTLRHLRMVIIFITRWGSGCSSGSRGVVCLKQNSSISASMNSSARFEIILRSFFNKSKIRKQECTNAKTN